MRPFVAVVTCPLTPEQAWQKVTDWPAHARWVPFTTIAVTPAGPTGVGTVVDARTAVGRFGFQDPMQVVAWDPPSAGGGRGYCRLEKQGQVVLGWAELTVGRVPGGTRVAWTEAAKPALLPSVTDPLSTVAGHLLFGRVLRRLLAA